MASRVGKFLMGTVLHPASTASEFSIIDAIASRGLFRPAEFTPASLLLLATPQYANELYAAVAKHEQFSAYGAVVDVVPPGGKRNGISYLWTSDPITLNHSLSTLLEDARQQHSHNETQGRFVSKGGQQWALNRLYLSLGFNGGEKSIRLQAASTIFETGVEGVIAARQNDEVALYSSMELSIPLSISFKQPDRQPPISVLQQTEPMYVTSLKDNIIKTINGKPASSFLEESLAASLFLDAPPPTGSLSKDDIQKSRTVYAVLDDSSRWKVIAGGGGWGARAGMLVLDPEVKIREGAKIQFLATNPEVPPQGPEVTENMEKGRMYFECVEPIQSLEETTSPGEVSIDGVFGAGSENQFFVGRKKFDVHGEYCVASVDNH